MSLSGGSRFSLQITSLHFERILSNGMNKTAVALVPQLLLDTNIT